jgi:hypothetical protein
VNLQEEVEQDGAWDHGHRDHVHHSVKFSCYTTSGLRYLRGYDLLLEDCVGDAHVLVLPLNEDILPHLKTKDVRFLHWLSSHTYPCSRDLNPCEI